MISEKDLERCAEIEYNCWRENYAPLLKISDYLYFQTKTSLYRELEKLSEDKNVHFILAQKKEVISNKTVEMKTIITGFIVIKFDTARGRYIVEKYYVDPRYQDEEVGTCLLRTVIQTFNDKDIGVNTFNINRKAVHIFLKLGFRYTMDRKMDLVYGKNILTFSMSYFVLERKKK